MAPERSRDQIHCIAQGRQERRITLLQRFATRNDLRRKLATISLPAICKRKQAAVGNSYAHPSNSQANARQGRGSGMSYRHPKGRVPRPASFVARGALLFSPDASTHPPGPRQPHPASFPRSRVPSPGCPPTPPVISSRYTRPIYFCPGRQKCPLQRCIESASSTNLSLTDKYSPKSA